MVGLFASGTRERPVLTRVAPALRSCSRRARAARYLAAALALGFGTISLGVDLRDLDSSRVYDKDFVQEYVLARAIADRAAPYAPVQDLAARYIAAQPDQPLTSGMGVELSLPTPHPPPVGLLFLPFALVDYRTAAWMWFGIELGLLVISVVLLGHEVGLRPSWLRAAPVALVLIGWTPVRQELLLGQLSMLLLMLLAWAWLSMQSDRPIRTGLLLGVALAIKPVVWLVLPLLAIRRQWRTVAVAVIVVLLAYALAVVAIGPNQLMVYTRQVLPAVNDMFATSDRNFSLAGLIESRNRSEAGLVVSFALRLLLVLAALAAVRSCRRVETWLGLGICVSLLVNPISWDHYLLLSLPAWVHVGANLIRQALPSRETAIAAIAAALTSVPVGSWMLSVPLAFPLLEVGYAVSLLLLSWLMIRTDRAPNRRYASAFV
jgi:hypothetical protein